MVVTLHLSFDSYRKHFFSGFKKLSDSPAILPEAKFEFDRYADQIIKYITSDDLPTPLTIGLNGEWGSGKTTLVRIIQEKIERYGLRSATNTISIKHVEFNAWDAEKSSITVSLWKTIESKLLTSNERNILEPISKLLVDVALRKTVNMSYDNAKKHFEEYSQINYRDKIADVPKCLDNKRLIIFIDDLDRCDASNILDVLEIIKNVLAIENVIFFITVDIKQIERAWELRYGQGVQNIESKEYIEKLFPIIFTLPAKSGADIEEYVNGLLPLESTTEPDLHRRYEPSLLDLRAHLVQSLENNPRKIKRILNTIYFIIQNSDDHSFEHSDLPRQFARYFAFIITWVCIAINHREIAEIIKIDPSALIHVSLFLDKYANFSDFKDEHEKFRNQDVAFRFSIKFSANTSKDIEFRKDWFSIHANNILEFIISKDVSAFKPLKHVARFINKSPVESPQSQLQYTQETIRQRYQQYTEMLKNIIEKGGLIDT